MSAPSLPAPRTVGGGGPNSAPYRVCFVCTGNICRSPMAEVVLRSLARHHRVGDGATLGDHLVVSSVGTGPWHEGEPMDPRAARALGEGGYADHGHVAHQFQTAWFAHLDLLVALDRRHAETLRSLGAGRHDDRLVLLRQFDPGAGGAVDVADPYYGDAAAFARCLAEVEGGCRGLAAALAAQVFGAAA